MIVFSGVETTRGSFSDNGDIYTIRIDGTGLKRLTTHTAYDGMPSFSPDGKKIVFVSEHDAPRDRPQVWIMNADGTGRTRLSHSDCREASPSFSRDGRRICFDRYFLPGKNGKPSINLWGAPRSWHVFTMNTDGTSETQLTVNLSTPPRSETSVAFFPNDNMILFLSGMASERNGFWLIDSQGQERTPVGSLNVSTFGQDPVSVRGNEVIVLTAPNALCIWNWDTRDLARVPTGGPPQTLRPDMSQPVLLPNGKDILLLVQEDRRYSCGLGAYWTVGRDGTNWRRVTPNHSLGQHP
jgi:dipeptidyl aminopeptidase/acylaminoacyl peptidase